MQWVQAGVRQAARLGPGEIRLVIESRRVPLWPGSVGASGPGANLGVGRQAVGNRCWKGQWRLRPPNPGVEGGISKGLK